MLGYLAPAIFVIVLLYHFASRGGSIHKNGQRLRYNPSELSWYAGVAADSDLRSAPDTLPLLGNAIKFLQPRHVLFDWFVQCQKKHGRDTVQISVPTLPQGVLISSPANVEYVLKNEASITKGEFFKRRSWDLFGA